MSEELEKGFAGKRKRKGCGLGCLTAIIVVVGMLAGSYLVSSHPYRHRAYNSSSNMDAKNAYTAAQKCFEAFPLGLWPNYCPYCVGVALSRNSLCLSTCTFFRNLSAIASKSNK